jgi:hypothetical protein
MCPECIPTVAVMAAGASSIGSLSLFFIKDFVRTMCEKALYSDSQKRNHHDSQHNGTFKSRNTRRLDPSPQGITCAGKTINASAR